MHVLCCVVLMTFARRSLCHICEDYLLSHLQEDDHHVIMFTREPDNRRLGNTTRRREVTQMSQDERLARHLQAQFDRELDVSAVTHPSSSSSSSSTSSSSSSSTHRRLFGELRGRRRSQADSNLWSSRGVRVGIVSGCCSPYYDFLFQPSGVIPSLPIQTTTTTPGSIFPPTRYYT